MGNIPDGEWSGPATASVVRADDPVTGALGPPDGDRLLALLVGPDHPKAFRNCELSAGGVGPLWFCGAIGIGARSCSPSRRSIAAVNYGYADDQVETIEKLTYDLYYIKHMSPVMDLRIFWKSIWTVLTGAGAR
jgi:hypothetical protein